jgi:hypothetical protein
VVERALGAYRLFIKTTEFRFEIEETFRVLAKRDWAFRVVMLPTCEFMYGIVKVS